jgi:hypothetical protein
MDTFSVNTNTRTSSAVPKFHISVLPNTKAAYDPLLPLTSLTITGSLPDGRQLTRPLNVNILYDDGEVIVSEPLFHIHSVGATRLEALREFRRVLVEELDELTADEEELGTRLKDELRYLRSLIRMV